MVRRHISGEVKKLALSMYFQGLNDREVRGLTGISERSLKRLRNTFRNTGGVLRVSPGRFRMLTAMEVKVRGTLLSIVSFSNLCTAISLFVIVSRASQTSPSRSCRQSSK
jgi:hypothetical protein